MQSIPFEKNNRPSGSTNHHFPPYLAVRKKPVPRSNGPRFQPPNLSHDLAPCSDSNSVVSAKRFAVSSSVEWTLLGQSAWMYCPNVSMNGNSERKSSFGRVTLALNSLNRT